jgi:hypothetical protein
MLSYSEAKNIVYKQLDCLDSRIYSVTTEDRESYIVYFVQKSGAFLGKFRVSQEPDGKINYGPLQGDGAEWALIWESLLLRSLYRADGRMSPELEQKFTERQEYYKCQLQPTSATNPEPDGSSPMWADDWDESWNPPYHQESVRAKADVVIAFIEWQEE